MSKKKNKVKRSQLSIVIIDISVKSINKTKENFFYKKKKNFPDFSKKNP